MRSKAAVDAGAALLAVCGGYQLLGHGYAMGGERLPGVGLVDLETVREEGPRLIGNVAIELADGQVLAGFENHGGRTRLGPAARPLGRVLKGHGNDGRSGYEGVLGGAHGTVVGTYLHGPLLPKNAHFADWLTAAALGVELAPLDTTMKMVNRLIEPTVGPHLRRRRRHHRGRPRRSCAAGSATSSSRSASSRTGPSLDNIATVPALLGWNKAKARAAGGRAARPGRPGPGDVPAPAIPAQLSGGQRQRVGRGPRPRPPTHRCC